MIKVIIDGKEIQVSSYDITIIGSMNGQPPRPPPPWVCPTGQHWDAGLKQCVVDAPLPPAPPPVETEDGSKDHPFKMSSVMTKMVGWTGREDLGFNQSIGTFSLKPGVTYFEMALLEVLGERANPYLPDGAEKPDGMYQRIAFMNVKGYGDPSLEFFYFRIHRASGIAAPEIHLGQTGSLGYNIWNPNTFVFSVNRIIWGINNPSGLNVSADIWWNI